MKIPLLPDTDLARIAPLQRDQKRKALEAFRVSHPPYRYVPFRKSMAEILNVQTGFLPATERAAFSHVEQAIRLESRSVEEFEANLRVAQSLYDHAATAGIEGRQLDLYPLSLRSGAKLTFWHSLLIIRNGEPVIPFFDPRRTTTRLTAQARQFVFSTMHERIRVADPDFANVRLAIIQFKAPAKGARVPVFHFDEGVPLLTFEELDQMVQDTYDMWADVYLQRTKTEPKRRSGGLL